MYQLSKTLLWTTKLYMSHKTKYSNRRGRLSHNLLQSIDPSEDYKRLLILQETLLIDWSSTGDTHLLLTSHGDCGVDGVEALAEAVGVHGVVVLV